MDPTELMDLVLDQLEAIRQAILTIAEQIKTERELDQTMGKPGEEPRRTAKPK